MRKVDSGPHPLPVTVHLIADALKLLREEDGPRYLYRGLTDRDVPPEFLERGGTELAPMSTTSDVDQAIAYAMQSPCNRHCVMMRCITNLAHDRAPDISFLSAFPAEREYLFPPLTYLKPSVGGRTTFRERDGSAYFEVIDIMVRMG